MNFVDVILVTANSCCELLQVGGRKPDAYYLITQVLFGQRMAETASFCSVCGTMNSRKRCPLCRVSSAFFPFHPYCEYDFSCIGMDLADFCINLVIFIAARSNTFSRLIILEQNSLFAVCQELAWNVVVMINLLSLFLLHQNLYGHRLAASILY